jgi:lysine 6-dehydrogenase
VDVSDKQSVLHALKGFDAAISCVPYKFNYLLAQACVQSSVNFVDLGGNNDVVAKELSLHSKAKKKGILIVPDCGLAPGLVSILTKYFVDFFDKIEEVHLRVGGLPQKPKPPLNYALVFSVSGLVNEYIEPVVRLHNYKIETVKPLVDLENFTFSGIGRVEAFNTSGGTSTLPQTYKGKIKELDYKTIRFPGHCEKIKKLIKTIPRREKLEKKLLEILPKNQKDMILLKAWAIGKKKGKRKKITFQILDKFDNKTKLTAMQRMTSFSAAIILELIGGVIKEKGVLTLEHVAPAEIVLKELKKRGIKIQKRITS